LRQLDWNLPAGLLATESELVQVMPEGKLKLKIDVVCRTLSAMETAEFTSCWRRAFLATVKTSSEEQV
jgi:hypothetical protein